jgi:hypothetical protein
MAGVQLTEIGKLSIEFGKGSVIDGGCNVTVVKPFADEYKLEYEGLMALTFT